MTQAPARMIEELVDTARYPLADPDSDDWRTVIAGVHEDLRTVGCSVLTDFIVPAARPHLQWQSAGLAGDAYYGVETVNVYNTVPDRSLPPGHPARVTVERGNAFVARDRIPAQHIVHQLYTDAMFQHFVASCFGLPAVHALADPLAGLCLNVVRPGHEHPWHFDTNEFTVTMLTQLPQGGGVFEYCPNIRTPAAENFTAVGAVLGGRAEGRIQRLALRPGDLQLFRGRYSLHRVTPVTGSTARHTAIFAYSEHPGVVGTVARTRQLFGRVAPEHRSADAQRKCIDALLS